MMLLLCQQTLQIKTAGWDQTPTAYPQDETRKPNKLVKQATALSSVHGVADSGWGQCREGQRRLATSNLQSGHVDIHALSSAVLSPLTAATHAHTGRQNRVA